MQVRPTQPVTASRPVVTNVDQADGIGLKKAVSAGKPVAAGSAQSRPVVAGSGKKKIGRNDPCWCGSGKKWKKCHYPQEASA